MSDKTGIEWADSTFNPWMGCTKVSPACDHCYAERDTKRFGRVQWGAGQPRVRTSAGNWQKPLQWNASACWFIQCNDCGWRGESKGALCQHCHSGNTEPARRRVFCASLADVFDNDVDPAWRADLFSLIEKTPNLDWMLLTKRIGNVTRMVEEATDLIDYGEGWQSMWGQGRWPENVWLGATICNQEEADRDIPKLLKVPAAVRFISMEPLLRPVDLRLMEYGDSKERTGTGIVLTTRRRSLDWVIVGGESGPNARPMHPAWARSLRDQCAAAGVPFIFKQWGEWIGADQEQCPVGPPESRWMWGDGTPFSYTDEGRDGRLPLLCRAGKQAAGRLLDGVQHDGYPEVRHA